MLMALTNKPLGRGDIIMVSNDPKPETTNEQKGTRPWLIVSRRKLNGIGPFVWAVPFTTTVRDYPLAINWTKEMPETRTHGTLLCDQLATLDVRHRQWRYVEHTAIPGKVDLIIQAILGYK